MSNRDLSRPHVFEKGTNSRVLLLMHGTGADEFDLLSLGKAIDPHASLLAPRGMHLENGMNRYFERYPDGSFNELSIDTAVDELADFVQIATEHFQLAGKVFTAVGFSNGANTAAALMLRRPRLIESAVLFGSTRPYKEPPSADLTGKRIWLANGDNDPYAPNNISEIWIKQLGEMGADAKRLRHPGGHQISSQHVLEIAKEL